MVYKQITIPGYRFHTIPRNGLHCRTWLDQTTKQITNHKPVADTGGGGGGGGGGGRSGGRNPCMKSLLSLEVRKAPFCAHEFDAK